MNPVVGKIEQFQFKQFSVSHARSSMKVGIDGVLIGAWGSAEGKRGLDIGTGCGLIALMAAQRNPSAQIVGVDSDRNSAEEAGENFRQSKWNDRLTVINDDILKFAALKENEEKFDFILSNPPFFKSGIHKPETVREKARHERELTIERLVEISGKMLNEGGTLSIILPAQRFPNLEIGNILSLEEVCYVSNKSSSLPKRVLVKWKKSDGIVKKQTELFIRDEDGTYSLQYANLTSGFYLRALR